MSISSEVGEKLLSLPEASAVAMRIDINAYFDVIKAITEIFAREKNLNVVYITATLPSASLLNAMRLLELETDHVYFVDAISRIMTSAIQKSDHIMYVESPTMLENILLKVEYLYKKSSVENKNIVVVLDSINSLAIHNNHRILSEFLHIMVNNLRTKEANTIIMAIEEQSTDELLNIIGFVCDETIVVKGPAEGGDVE